MRIFLITALTFINFALFGQSLGKERVKKIKESIVRISIGDSITGTGFFINQDGDIATCWHVIAPAVHQDYRRAYVFDKVQITTNDSEIDSADMYVYFLLNGYENANAYDYCILKLIHPLKHKPSFLKLGDFKNINEGDWLYSCGYPLSYQQNFLSSGICSTKYQQGLDYNYLGFRRHKIRDIMLVDITLNKGNSGSPIVKVGNTPANDEVVGIFDFINNPLAPMAEELEKESKKHAGTAGTERDTITGQMFMFSTDTEIFAQGLQILPTGINGCISIDYLKDCLKDYK